MPLRGFLNLAAFDAGRANTDAFSGAVHQRANRLQIEVPSPFGDIVRVADSISELGASPANFAHFRHNVELLRWKSECINFRMAFATDLIFWQGITRELAR